MIESILFVVSLIGVAVLAYVIGKQDAKKGRLKLYNDLVTSNAVRHNLNCLVGDLRAEVAVSGRAVKAGEKNRQEAVRLDALLHVQDVKVLELRLLLDDVRDSEKLLKADAAAWNQSKGLWCTDQPDIIRHHAKREMFFRLGYPEHRL